MKCKRMEKLTQNTTALLIDFICVSDKGRRKTIGTGNYLFRRRSSYIDHNKREILNMQEQQQNVQ